MSTQPNKPMRQPAKIAKAVGVSQAERERRTVENQTASPLLHLPAELRNRIYEYALGGSHTLKIRWVATSEPTTSRTSPISIPLLRVCTQIDAETALLPYMLDTFAFHNVLDIHAFVRVPTQAQVRAVRVLGINTVLGTYVIKDSKLLFIQREEYWYTALEPFKGLKRIEVEDKNIILRYTPERDQVFKDMAENLRHRVPGVTVTIWDKDLGRSSAGNF